MSKKEIPQNHLNFIKLIARGETYENAYKLTLPKERLSELTKGTAKTMGYKWAKKYAQEILATKKADADAVESAARIEKAREVFADIMTQAEVDAIMCAHIKDENKSISLKAMEMYNKRFGSYSPEKQRIETTNIPQVLNWNPNTNGSEKAE